MGGYWPGRNETPGSEEWSGRIDTPSELPTTAQQGEVRIVINDGDGAHSGYVWIDGVGWVKGWDSNGTSSETFVFNDDAAATDVEDVWWRMDAGRGAGGATVQGWRLLFEHDANGAAGSYEGDLTLQYAADVSGAFTDLLVIGGDGSITVAGTATVDIDGVAVEIDGTDDSHYTMSANAAGNKVLTVAATNAGAGEGHLMLSAADQVDLTDGTGTIKIDAGVVTLSDGSATLTLDGAGNLTETSLAAFTLVPGGNSTLACSAGTLSIQNHASGGNLYLGTAGTRDAYLGATTTTNTLYLRSGSGGIHGDATGGAISLDSAISSNVTVTANAAGDQTLTLQCTNAGAGDGFINIQSDNGATVTGDLTVTGTTGMAAVTVTSITKADAYTMLVTDYAVEAGTKGAPYSITLPLYASAAAGQEFHVVRTGADVITLDGAGTNISGAANQALNAQYDAITVYKGATEWLIK